MKAAPITSFVSRSKNVENLDRSNQTVYLRMQAWNFIARLTYAVSFSVLLNATLFSPARATTPARAELITCPLTGEVFQFIADYGSFTFFGRALDFEPLVMGMLRSSPKRVPQCAESGLPVYRDFTTQEINKLRSLVATQIWKDHLAVDNSSYLVAFTKSVLNDNKLSVANSLLSAVWSVTTQNRAIIISKALASWSLIAESRLEHDENWVVANWLRIELSRQLSEFDKAENWLSVFEQTLRPNFAPVTDEMIILERQLIAERNAEPAAVPSKPNRQ